MLFKRFVSRNVAWKGMAVLKGIGLPTEAILLCYRDCFLNEVEAVQMGLIKWREGGGHSPTWTVLLKAMECAEIPVQHIMKLKEELLEGAHYQLIMLTSSFIHGILSCIQAIVSIP